MTVNQYLYQSPSTSAVQVGRLDPSTKQEDTSSSQSAPNTNETAQKAQAFAATQVQEVTPTVSTNPTSPLLDTYA